MHATGAERWRSRNMHPIEFCSLNWSLEDLEHKGWVVKHKHHAMLEMALQGWQASQLLDLHRRRGGYLAGLARIQGG